MEIEESADVISGDSRREALLEAAVGVFARYGFRKTSMDEVARAAGVSRQGLYLLLCAPRRDDFHWHAQDSMCYLSLLSGEERRMTTSPFSSWPTLSRKSLRSSRA